jgi:hypothetical protein
LELDVVHGGTLLSDLKRDRVMDELTFREYNEVFARAVRQLGVSRQTLTRMIESHPGIKERVLDERLGLCQTNLKT